MIRLTYTGLTLSYSKLALVLQDRVISLYTVDTCEDLSDSLFLDHMTHIIHKI